MASPGNKVNTVFPIAIPEVIFYHPPNRRVECHPQKLNPLSINIALAKLAAEITIRGGIGTGEYDAI